MINPWHCSHLRSCVFQAAPVFVVIVPAVCASRLALTGPFLLYIRAVLLTNQLAWVYTLYTDQNLFFFCQRRNYYLMLKFYQSNSIVFYQMYTYKYKFIQYVIGLLKNQNSVIAQRSFISDQKYTSIYMYMKDSCIRMIPYQSSTSTYKCISLYYLSTVCKWVTIIHKELSYINPCHWPPSPPSPPPPSLTLLQIYLAVYLMDYRWVMLLKQAC